MTTFPREFLLVILAISLIYQALNISDHLREELREFIKKQDKEGK